MDLTLFSRGLCSLCADQIRVGPRARARARKPCHVEGFRCADATTGKSRTVSPQISFLPLRTQPLDQNILPHGTHHSWVLGRSILYSCNSLAALLSASFVAITVRDGRGRSGSRSTPTLAITTLCAQDGTKPAGREGSALPGQGAWIQCPPPQARRPPLSPAARKLTHFPWAPLVLCTACLSDPGQPCQPRSSPR